jgi:hypothetical protein
MQFFLYVFPYTPADLKAILNAYRKDDFPNVAALVKAVRANKWKNFENLIPNVFPHFREIDRRAQNACKGTPDKTRSPAFGRIIVVDRLSLIKRNDGSLHPMYGPLLGRNVPTFVSTRKEMRGQNFCDDDVVITRRIVSGNDLSDDADPLLREYRYFEKSELLVVRGHNCLAAGGAAKSDGLDRSQASRASALAMWWANHPEEIWQALENRGSDTKSVGPLEVVNFGP